MITVAAPTRVWQRLAAAPDGPREVVHAGDLAIYVDLDGGPAGCLGLVARSASQVPCALWSTLPTLAALTDLPVRVAGGTLVVGEQLVRVARLVDVRLPTPDVVAGRHGDWSPKRPLPVTSAVPGLPDDGHLAPAHVRALVGRGPGLTPLGDDVLAGWLAVRAAAGVPDPAVRDAVRQALPATTSLSATLLDCALHGETLPELAAWTRALGTPEEATAEAALLLVGASSGAGLLTGARLGLQSLTSAATTTRDTTPRDTTTRDTTAPSTIGHPGRVA